MTDLVKGPVMMSSLEICEVIAKLAKDKESGVVEKPHKNIIRDIRNMLESLDGSSLSHDSYIIEKDNRGYDSLILLNKDLTELLITGYSVPIRWAVLQEYKRKIAELEKPQPSTPRDYLEALKALVVSEETKLLLEAKIESDKPKVYIAEAYLNTDGLKTISQWVKENKHLGIKNRRFFELLRKEGTY